GRAALRVTRLIAEFAQAFLSLVLGQPILLLQLADQVFAVAPGTGQVIVREFSPLALDCAGQLLPVALDGVLVHLFTSSTGFKWGPLRDRWYRRSSRRPPSRPGPWHGRWHPCSAACRSAPPPPGWSPPSRRSPW